MGAYILRRLFLIIPTLVGILLLNFAVLQIAPGGPVEALRAKLDNVEGSVADRIGGGGDETFSQQSGPGSGDGALNEKERFLQQFIKDYGLDRPAHEQFLVMVGNFFTFDFGTSFTHKKPVIDMIAERLDVTVTLGVWSLIITYLVSIPLGVRKAVREGTPFDNWTSILVIGGYAVPVILFGVLLIVLFAGPTFLNIFPTRGLTSIDADQLSWFGQVIDYLHHIVLPITALVIGSFATLALLTKNSFLDEIKKQYVITARAKGVAENRVLYGHVFRNAMLIVIAGFPAAFIAIFTTGSIVIENLFSLDGLGALSIQALSERDYPIVLGTLFIFSLMALIAQLLTDITYTLVDPRIDFEAR